MIKNRQIVGKNSILFYFAKGPAKIWIRFKVIKFVLLLQATRFRLPAKIKSIPLLSGSQLKFIPLFFQFFMDFFYFEYFSYF